MVESGEVNTLATYHPDRLTRSPEDPDKFFYPAWDRQEEDKQGEPLGN